MSQKQSPLTVGLLILPTKKAGRSPPLKTLPNKLRTLATGRSRSLRYDVLCVLQICENVLGIAFELMGIRSLVDEVLKVISRLLILGFVAGAVQRESGAQICVRVIRVRGQNLLILSERLITRACVKQHLGQIQLRL